VGLTDEKKGTEILHRRGTYRVDELVLAVDWEGVLSPSRGALCPWQYPAESEASEREPGTAPSLLEVWPTAVLLDESPESRGPNQDASPGGTFALVRTRDDMEHTGNNEGTITREYEVRVAATGEVVTVVHEYGDWEYHYSGDCYSFSDNERWLLVNGLPWRPLPVVGADGAVDRGAAMDVQPLQVRRTIQLTMALEFEGRRRAVQLSLGRTDSRSSTHPEPAPLEPAHPEDSVVEGKPPLDLERVVSRQTWAMTWFLLALILGGFFLFSDVPGMTTLAGWMSIVLVVVGLVLQPSPEDLGDEQEAVTKLVGDRFIRVFGRVVMFVLAWGLIIYGVDMAGWMKDKAGEAYEAVGDVASDLLQSDEEAADELLSEREKVIDGLSAKGATSERFETEKKLADEVAAMGKTDAIRDRAIQAYGRAATTASSRDDLNALEDMIDKQIELDRARGGK
jgi:hypothetical protein